MNNFNEFLFNRNLLESAMNRSPNDLNKTIYSSDDQLLEIPYYINEHGYISETLPEINDKNRFNLMIMRWDRG